LKNSHERIVTDQYESSETFCAVPAL